jgi:quercetin dioxygenase-like cupin family protein
MKLALIAVLTILAGPALADDFPSLKRDPLLDEAIPAQNPAIKLVHGARIRFAPRQPTGLHRHPISVVGVVTQGGFIYKREGEPERIIKAGDSFFEPAGVTMERFDNASSTEPAEIVAFYLTDSKERPLIEMLNAK